MCRAIGLGGFRRQVTVDVEGVGLEHGAQRLPGEVFYGDAAAEGAVVDFQVEVVERQAGRCRGQPADQLDFAQAAFGHGREFLADAVDEFRQVELGNRDAAADLWGLVQIVDLQFTQCPQLVGRDLDAGPLGNVGGPVQHQLALGGERHGLALQGVAGHFPRQLHILELIALQCTCDAQLTVEFGTHPQCRLVG
ncbi:hypothetical protein D3C76_1037820 [compost metagenome]